MAIQVNINKAKDITKDRLREERKPLLEAQDVAFQRALEAGADTSAIVAEKQRLRDITNQVDNLNTVEELKAVSVKVERVSEKSFYNLLWISVADGLKQVLLYSN